MTEYGTYSFGMYASFFGSWSTVKKQLDEWDSCEPPHRVQRAQSGALDEKGSDGKDLGEGDAESMGSAIAVLLNKILNFDEYER